MLVSPSLQAFAAYENAQSRQSPAIKAQLLSEEGIEVLHLVRIPDGMCFPQFPPRTKKYFYFSGTTWSVTTTPEIIDGVFYRSFTMASASRNSSFNIVSSGGMVDPQTLLATVSVSVSDIRRDIIRFRFGLFFQLLI